MTSASYSRLPGFFLLPIHERRQRLMSLPLSLHPKDFIDADQGLSLDDADMMIENVIGTYTLPLSVACNFIIDEKPALIPMVTEESSIVAGCSKMAKIVAQAGGFYTEISPSLIKGQIQFYNIKNISLAIDNFSKYKADILSLLHASALSMKKRGGGVVDIDFRILESSIGPMLIVEPLFNVVDAMGANFVNTILEVIAPKINEIINGSLGFRILSNLCDHRLAKARCSIPFTLLSECTSQSGAYLAEKIIAGHAFAEADKYRATTHNKGILNGIEAVALATGNDTRAIEAGAHAFAATTSYMPLTKFFIDQEALHAELNLPMAVGVVGGVTSFHQGVKLSHKILGHFGKTAKGLASVMVSVGLAQCLAALTALADEGIQKGHMKLHLKKKSQGAYVFRGNQANVST